MDGLLGVESLEDVVLGGARLCNHLVRALGNVEACLATLLLDGIAVLKGLNE